MQSSRVSKLSGPGGRPATAVWAAAVAVYVMAVFHRTSLGVAGLAASERFDIEPAQLSVFAVVQVGVYGVLQIPVGILIDRVGPRRLLLTALTVMSAAQLLVSVSGGYGWAVVARVLVGAGDAMVFVSVLRLVSAWFPPRRAPVMTALTASLGQVGALVATVPLAYSLAELGWTPTFSACAAMGLLVGALLWLVVRDSPQVQHRRIRRTTSSLENVRVAWEHPSIRLGFWTHVNAMFPVWTFVLLWGHPFLIDAQEMGSQAAASLLSLNAVVFVVAGPVVGLLVARHPRCRTQVAMSIVAGIVCAWAVVLLWPGPAPTVLLVLLATSLGLGATVGNICMEWARAGSPPAQLGLALAVVNCGAYLGALVSVLAVGLCLDVLTPDGATPSSSAYTWAMSTQSVLWGVGVTGILRAARRVKALAEEERRLPIVRYSTQ